MDPDIVLVPAGGTSRMMPLASLMFGAAGVKGKNMLVLLDSDKEGSNAKHRLDNDLFADDSRAVLLGSVLSLPKATIEDLVERPTYVAALNEAGYAVALEPAEEAAAACNADAVSAAFKRLGIGEFDHVAKTKAALWLVDRWSKDPNSVEQLTLDRAATLFKALNERFTKTTS